MHPDKSEPLPEPLVREVSRKARVDSCLKKPFFADKEYRRQNDFPLAALPLDGPVVALPKINLNKRSSTEECLHNQVYSLYQIRYQVFNLKRPRARFRSSKVASSRTTTQAQHGTFDTDAPRTRCNSKRRRSADADYGETGQRWKKMASDARGIS
jgi:hypothetical protein